MINPEDEAAMTRSFKNGFMEPIKDMAERFKKEGELREKVAESRYELTQKRLDNIERDLQRILKLLEDKK